MGSAEYILNFFDLRAFLLCLSLGLVVVGSIRWFLRRPRNLPPGPLSLPIVGCVLTLGFSFFKYRKQIHQLLTKLASKHGSIYSLDIGGVIIVVLNRYDCIKEAFQNPHLNDRPKVAFLKELHFKPGVIIASGEDWKEQRRFILSTFRSFGIGTKSFEEHITSETDALMKALAEHQNTPFDPHRFIINAVANIICSVVFGKRYDYSDESFEELVDVLYWQLRLMGSGGIQLAMPLTKYVTPKKHKQLASVIVRLGTIAKKIVAEHRLARDPECPKDFIDEFLNQMELNKKEGRFSHLDDSNLISTISNLFLAGTDTTATTLRWCIHYMLGYPDIQRRVQDEIDSVVGRNRLPRLSDMPDLPYTQATIFEIQRVSTAIPLGGAHRAAQATNVNGYSIPKGALIFSNLWAVHNDPEVWKEPSEFKPARFLDEFGKLQQRKELIPFSIGQRFCLADNLAKMELKLFFSHLLHRFTFALPPNSSPLSYEGSTGLTYTPKPYEIILTVRE